ncbi:hypothetical protein CRM22_000455 [Opisthorchis felineus]|uniref:Tetraspanin n=1 Tax=Opisthorchis felineus TaxID=147828 RepID=A0A4S2MFH7_OPIFE|nr:hypothetical protein CRM22_000455 [Opisthorchis felineus]
MLVVFNVVVICCGIGLVVAGSIVEYNVVTYLSIDITELHAFVIFIIGFGSLLTIIGIFGFFDACGKYICCLSMLGCCGPYGHWPIYLGLVPPDSCFESQGYLYGLGCVEALNDYIQINIVIIAICALIFSVLNILALILAVCVCTALKRGDDV